MEQSPSWEANRFSARQEIPGILWNPKVHYRFYKRPAPVSILSQINPVHTPHPTSWRSVLILSSRLHLRLASGLSFRFPHQNPARTSFLPRTYHMSRTSHFKIALQIKMFQILCIFPHKINIFHKIARIKYKTSIYNINFLRFSHW